MRWLPPYGHLNGAPALDASRFDAAPAAAPAAPEAAEEVGLVRHGPPLRSGRAPATPGRAAAAEAGLGRIAALICRAPALSQIYVRTDNYSVPAFRF